MGELRSLNCHIDKDSLKQATRPVFDKWANKMHDGTTGGGFVTIGTVISHDLDRIAQSRPLSTSRFLAVTIEQAIDARKERQKTINELAELLNTI
ncbi:hypothetical protein [Bacillus xiapuensis]|uniref:Carboxyltransferase domain-containing protein n=1 Tax=Bacillus xiapuensis TaxID=2014075 RepID=A0ABU6NDY7_9BACI|nr:hypothetical protein [Bacillus xiapuensis]